MNNIFELHSPLFADIQENNFESVLNCLHAHNKEYKRNNPIICEGEIISQVYLVCSGECQIIRNDFWGNRSIISSLSAGDLFGESFAASKEQVSKVDVIAKNDCSILSIDYQKLITTCTNSCEFHNKIIMNMLKILAERNTILTDKIEILSKRTLREKLLTYFTSIAKRCNSITIEIPFKRQELADFLSADRSSMCRELSNMQKDGILEINKNKVILKNSRE